MFTGKANVPLNDSASASGNVDSPRKVRVPNSLCVCVSVSVRMFV